jgi:hypothetical protein
MFYPYFKTRIHVPVPVLYPAGNWRAINNRISDVSCKNYLFILLEESREPLSSVSQHIHAYHLLGGASFM